MIRRSAVVGLVVAALSLGACGQRAAESMAERAIERAASRAGENVDVQLGADTMRVTDAEGNVATIGGGGVPENWPASIPVHPDVDIQFAASMVDGGKAGWTLNGTFDGPGKTLYDYYKRELSGWSSSADMVNQTDGATMYLLEVSDSSHDVGIVISEDDGETTVNFGVTER